MSAASHRPYDEALLRRAFDAARRGAGRRYFLSATILTPPRTCAPMRSTRRT